MSIREVWNSNLNEELRALSDCLCHYRMVFFDTEFPGCLRKTVKYASETQRYDDMQYNVNNTKLIQLGITLSSSDDGGEVGGTWEFNFSDFDIENDRYSEDSILLLKNNGLDFDKIHKDGIPVSSFAPRMLHILSLHRNLKWITFHGMYDFGYLLHVLTNRLLPPNVEDFARGILMVLGDVIDIKVVARHCQGLSGGEIGLAKLAKVLSVTRCGGDHNAGSDSLLTASVFAKMKQVYWFDERLFLGCLYGVSVRIGENLFGLTMPGYHVGQPAMFRGPRRPSGLCDQRHLHDHHHPLFCGPMQTI